MTRATENIIRSACAMDATVDGGAVDNALALLKGGGAAQIDEPLKAQEVAEMLKCTKRTVQNYADAGIIRRIGGGGKGKSQARYSKRSVLDFIAGKAA